MGRTWGKLLFFGAHGADLGELQCVGLARVNESAVVRPKRALHDSGLLGKPGQV